jgi:hypothetical protein
VPDEARSAATPSTLLSKMRFSSRRRGSFGFVVDDVAFKNGGAVTEAM